MLSRAMDRVTGRPVRWNAPPWDRNTADWLAIDQRLPSDHLARLIDRFVAELDLTELGNCYAGRGSCPHPPELLLRLVLYESWNGELSPSGWHRDCHELEPVKWLIFGLTPSRSSLYLFRDRCMPIIDGLNRHRIQIARAEGFVTPDDASLDGTFVAALGSRHRLVNAKALNKRLDQLDSSFVKDFVLVDSANDRSDVEDAGALSTAQTAPLADPPALTFADTSPAPDTAKSPGGEANSTLTAPIGSLPLSPTEPPAAANVTPPYWMAKTPGGRFRQRMRYRAAQAALDRKQQSHQQTLSRTAKSKRRPVERITICLSEPDAALGVDKVKTFRPLYNVQLARALGDQFIIGYDVVAEVTDAGQFGPLTGRVNDLSGQLPKRVAVDEKYAGQADLALAHRLGIEIYAPTDATKRADGSHKKPDEGMVPKHQFVWLPEQKTYRCPQGHFLKFVSSSKQTRQGGEALEVTQYRCPPEHCQVCPLQAKCTRTPERGRIVKRNEHDDLVEELRTRMQRPESQEFYARRKQTVEPTFGDFKEHRGLRQFRGFGLARARAQVGMLVLAYNGLNLLKARVRQRQQSNAGSEHAA
jgi:transposase